MNKIKIIRHEITMVYCYIVEYLFSNGFDEVVKRQKYKSGFDGLSLARKKYISGVKYIKWNQSEDYEQIELKALTSTDGLVTMLHYDTIHGYQNHNAQEVYCDGC